MKKSDINKIIKELDEISVAVSVTGTSKKKLGQLIQLVKPVFDQLHGDRQEIISVKNEGIRFIHNLSKTSTKAKEASKVIKSGIPILKKVNMLLDKDIGIKRDISFGDMKIIDNIGHSGKEINDLLNVLKKSETYLKKHGLNFLIKGSLKTASPDFLEGAVFYSVFNNSLYVKLSEKMNEYNMLESFADKLWLEYFDNADVKLWKLDDKEKWNSYGRFINEFMNRVYKNKPNKELDIVWRETVGRITNEERGKK